MSVGTWRYGDYWLRLYARRWRTADNNYCYEAAVSAFAYFLQHKCLQNVRETLTSILSGGWSKRRRRVLLLYDAYESENAILGVFEIETPPNFCLKRDSRPRTNRLECVLVQNCSRWWSGTVDSIHFHRINLYFFPTFIFTVANFPTTWNPSTTHRRELRSRSSPNSSPVRMSPRVAGRKLSSPVPSFFFTVSHQGSSILNVLI